MIFDTNLILRYIREGRMLPSRVVIPIVVIGELETLALRNDWGYQKVKVLQHLLDSFPIADLNRDITRIYAELDVYSQGKSRELSLPPGTTARNMGKNDLWIAATALYLDMELHTLDKDFDHLALLGLKLKNPVV